MHMYLHYFLLSLYGAPCQSKYKNSTKHKKKKQQTLLRSYGVIDWFGLNGTFSTMRLYANVWVAKNGWPVIKILEYCGRRAKRNWTKTAYHTHTRYISTLCRCRHTVVWIQVEHWAYWRPQLHVLHKFTAHLLGRFFFEDMVYKYIQIPSRK